MPSAPPARNVFVDLLRGVSILAVMCMHLGLPPWAAAMVHPKVTAAVANSYYFVTVFFVISGYLIAATSIRRYGSLGSIDLAHFAKFRFGRIVPLLALTLILLLTLGFSHAVDFVMPKGLSLLDAAAAVLSLQFNEWYATHGSWRTDGWNAMWSLSIEEIFYVLLPIACRTFQSRRLIVGWLLVCIPFAFRARLQANGLLLFSGCIDALSIGVLTAIVAEEGTAVRASRPFASLLGMAAGLATLLYVCQLAHPAHNLRWGPLLVALGAAVFIYASTFFPTSAVARRLRRASTKVPALTAVILGAPLLLLSALGRYSYEAYLLHMPAYRFIRSYVWPEGDHLVVIAFIGLGSCLVNLGFTEPMNRLIRGDGWRTLLARPWGPIRVPALVALSLVVVPNVVVRKDVTHPSAVQSVSLTIKRELVGDTAAPLVVSGETADADFLSIKKLGDGSMALQFDHWGAAPVTRTISPDLLKDSFVVSLDCAAPAALVEGAPILTKADLAGLSAHDELAIGANNIGGTTMAAAAAAGLIQSSTVTFDNGATTNALAWRRGE
jgi:peptidoglycan/LPS O-acetylase OafA/YrhL